MMIVNMIGLWFKMPLNCYTSYCFDFLGDKPGTAGSAPIRKCSIMGYDGDKRVLNAPRQC
jgi:hypothetical protein